MYRKGEVVYCNLKLSDKRRMVGTAVIINIIDENTYDIKFIGRKEVHRVSDKDISGINYSMY